jgi:phosphate starvation-inducible protein PhoH and related proteins
MKSGNKSPTTRSLAGQATRKTSSGTNKSHNRAGAPKPRSARAKPAYLREEADELQASKSQASKSQAGTAQTKIRAPKRRVRTIEFEPFDNERLASLNGPFDQHLRDIELKAGVVIHSRGNIYEIAGSDAEVRETEGVLRELYALTEDRALGPEDLFLSLKGLGELDELSQNKSRESGTADKHDPDSTQEVQIKTRKGTIRGRGDNQRQYLHQIATHDINFGVGPAGTGKTYLAVAMAVEALESNRVQRLLLVRPAVEAGEKLGFLPGDLIQKVDPYLRPLYDALYEMIGVEKVGRLIERNVIEVAPLAFMRGRTLNDAFILLDEAQNTTVEQMKMFLTRIGFGSTAVITGDMTQVDLPRHIRSGLRHAIAVLKGVEGISLTFFEAKDVVRHPLVQRIVMAYERHEAATEQSPDDAH